MAALTCGIGYGGADRRGRMGVGAGAERVRGEQEQERGT